MPPTWTETEIVNNMLRTGMSWAGATITYSFPTTAPSWAFPGEGPGFSPLSAAQQAAARAALTLWDDIMAVDFVEVAGPSDITLQNTTTGIDYAHAYLPDGNEWGGSVWLNPNYGANSGTNNLVTPTAGAWGFLTYIHEIGHALGFPHPGDYNGGNPTYARDAAYAQDTIMFTVMSYFDAKYTGADWRASDGKEYYAQTPMLHDILAIQALYGVETATRAGDTVYGFNATAGNVLFDFTQNAHPILTIWDGGGNDWLDLSGFATASRIDLNQGAFTDCDGMTKNIAIAFGCDIENARGGAGNDSLTGNALGNTLEGGGGNDVLTGGGGADILIGGEGNDTFYADVIDFFLQFNGGGGYDILYVIGAFSFSYDYLAHGFEEFWVGTLVGTDAGETLNGTTDTDLIRGLGGNDTLNGLDDDDILVGGAGNDKLYGGAGSDTASYEDATAAVTVSLASTKLQKTGGAGNDTLNGIENLRGSAFSDKLTGSIENNVIEGLAGNDTLDGGAGADTLMGGTGNDTYVVDNALDLVDETGGDGTDTVQTALAFSLAALGAIENLTLTGAAAINGTGNGLDNVITGNSGVNTLTGAGGNDTLNGGAGADTMFGGTGNDTYVVDNVGDLVDETGGDGTDTVQTALAFSLAALGAIENLTLTGTAAVSGTGNGLANVITGNTGNNTLIGLGGADQLIGGAGTDMANYAASGSGVNVSLATGLGSGGDAQGDTLTTIENVTGSDHDDTLEGNGLNNVLAGGLNGTGGDTVTYANAAAGVTVSLALTRAQKTVGAGTDTLTGFENLTGSAHNDTLTGNTGNNVLRGLAGNDTLTGGTGADTMFGGTGNDTYVVDNTGDLVDETGGDGIDLVKSSVTFDLSGGAVTGQVENLQLTGTAAINGTGNGLDNVIEGNSGANMLDGGNGIDTVSYANAAAAVKVDLSIATAQATGSKSGIDTLLNFENLTGSKFGDTLTGDGGGNTIMGLAGNDKINGGAGDDVLVGGTGKDTLSGGADDDIFVFQAVIESARGANRDLVTDFVVGEDQIDLSAIDAITGGADDAFTFAGSFTGVAGQLAVSYVGGQTIIAGDLNGDRRADFEIALTGTHTLTTDDFIL